MGFRIYTGTLHGSWPPQFLASRDPSQGGWVGKSGNFWMAWSQMAGTRRNHNGGTPPPPCKSLLYWPLAHAKFTCDWPPVAYTFHPNGRQSHANCTRVATSRMQHEKNQRKFACDWPPFVYNLHASVGHSGTICMRLAANCLQDKR